MSWWVEIDGRVLPRQLAGHPALELCNTRSGWGEPFDDRQEYLRGFAWLVTLARANGLLTYDRADELTALAERRKGEAAEELERAKKLRRDLYAVVTHTASRAAIERVARAVGDARSRQQLVPRGAGFGWEFTGRPRLADVVDLFLIAAGELLCSPDLARVRPCPGVGCGWLFVNGSGRRRWCQMEVCGNRAKQRRHTGRQRGQQNEGANLAFH